MRQFEQLLAEALAPTHAVTADDFIKFAAAIATSTLIEKIPAALQRAAALPPEQLTQIISQVQYIGDLTGLRNAVATKPEYVTPLTELARKVLPETEVFKVIGIIGHPKASTPEVNAASVPASWVAHEPDRHEPEDDGNCPACGEKVSEDDLAAGGCGCGLELCDNCGYYYDPDTGCEECSHYNNDEGEEEYNVDTDYYVQHDGGGC